MTDFISNLATGFSVALLPTNILACFIGALVGTLIGVLPGIGTVATIAMLLPLTFGFPPETSLIMLAGIYYGAQYGGSTTSILVNIPGEASSIVTALDGYQMARQGHAGRALAMAAISSFFAGCVATLLVSIVGQPLTAIALTFGASDYFALLMLGLALAVVLAGGSVLKAVAMVFMGLLLAMVGSDLESGAQRLTFGLPQLVDGMSFSVVAMGLFGYAEIFRNLDGNENDRSILNSRLHGLMPTWDDLKRCFFPVVRGTGLGAFLGVLPGGGATVSSFAAYAMEKKISRNRAQMGKGAIEGVAAPEAANNAAAQTSFVPLLTLGLPSNAVMALMLGAMMIQGIVPGPQVIDKQPTLVWGLIVSMWVGNLVLLIINLPLVGLWVKLLKIPYRLMFPSIVVFCSIGMYSINNSPFDVVLAGIFGLVGYGLSKLDFEPTPLILGLVLGLMVEENLRRALIIRRGNLDIFVTSPITLFLLIVAAGLLIVAALPSIRSKRDALFVEEI